VESSAGAAAAAAKAAALVSQGTIELDPFVARVDEARCSGCRVCLGACAYEAISRDDGKGVAVVNEALCTGCGTCVAACPCSAMTQLGFSDTQMKSEILALLAGEVAAAV
jgi:heterodisulfide reductase subunit A